MDERPDVLGRARQAHRAQDWVAAAAHFDAVATELLTADDLAAHADAVWWLGRVDDNLRLEAAACEAFLADARPADAAWAAVRIGLFLLGRGDEPQGLGWIGKAARLLDGVPECHAHGFLLLLTRLEPTLQAGRPAEAVEVARRVRELGHRIGRPDLVALGLNGEGRALVKAGHVVDGLALLDEAMVAVLDGRLTPFASGSLYCHTIATCHEVADLRRMARWVDLTERWLAGFPAAALFGGLCAVHRAQLHLVRGEWAEAERTASAVADALDATRVDYAAEAWYVVAEARRLRGDPSAADAYDEAHARGRDPQPGRALLRLPSDPAGAVAAVRAAVAAAGADPLRRAPLCAALVEIAIAAGHLDDAVRAATEIEATASTYATSGLQAMAATARGAVLLAQDRAADALPVLRDACLRWREFHAPHDAAGTCVLLSRAYRALGDDVSADAETAQAKATYARLGAHQPPDGLTPRECEVLALVAAGRSNREIGEALFISDRTVARHVTNIFHKIGVTSRTQAVRYALDRGLTATG
ncbi:LuxR C-terminal-related transcriptional regulator [Saccharothrix variisporea]|uniref:LuxR C-terminal-related transcriptional regulator n=1 Tax=Saccharothrix variisporea TaxID=543527 RepID=UPI0011C35923|nr:helix-turn-helix transcriptional regulator [Saccharothrix variisporea]